LVVMRVKCADANNRCTFTLVPVEWTGAEPWKKTKLLGRMSGGGFGRRLFYVEGQLSQGRLSGAWETRVIDAFKLEPVEP